MKKILLILSMLLLGLNSAHSADFKGCKTHYNDQKFNQSASCFGYLVKINPDDVQSRFWYAASLFFNRNYKESYAQYNYIAQKYPNSEIGKYSKAEAEKVSRKMQNIQQAKIQDTGNYAKSFEHTTKWYKMPVSVWIQPCQYSSTASKALYEWQYKSNNLVRFTTTAYEKDAQIKIYFVDKIQNPVSEDNLGVTRLKYIGNMNISAVIEILRLTDSNRPRSNAQIFPVVLHEVGHALGMAGHSTSNNDIMFPNNATNDIHLSQKDINTLKAIYQK